MSLSNALWTAAHVADGVVYDAMRKYREGRVGGENELTGDLFGVLEHALNREIEGLTWRSTYLAHGRGIAAEEKRVGADILIHVSLDTPVLKYSKGVLVQAKRYDPGHNMSTAAHKKLKGQCDDMLRHSSHSWVFNYSRLGMRCAPAVKISGSSTKDLHRACDWTSYRFFLELFRCPVGDPGITSSLVADLPVLHVLKLAAEGDIHEE